MFTKNYYNMLQLAATLRVSYSGSTSPSWPSSIPQIKNSAGYYLCPRNGSSTFHDSTDALTVPPSIGMPFLNTWIRFTTETSASEDDYNFPSDAATAVSHNVDLNVEVDGNERYLNAEFSVTYSNDTNSSIVLTAFKVMKSLRGYWSNASSVMSGANIVIVSQVLDTPITLAVGERKKLTVQFKIPLNY